MILNLNINQNQIKISFLPKINKKNGLCTHTV